MKEIADFFGLLFDSNDWPPRWHCGKWTEFHGWLYIVSDLLIWSAYFAIPVVIIKYLSRKQDARFIRLYFLFAAFILACGATHFFDAVSFWVPLYRLNALVRLVTGVISWITVFYIVRYLPKLISLRPLKDLEQEIEQRQQAEEQVSRLNAELDNRIAERTAELSDYKYALDQSSIVAITDQKGIIRHVNNNFCRISGYSSQELIGQDHRIINSGYHSKEYIRNLWVTIANGGIWKGELKNEAKDGSTYWVDTTIVPFLNSEGKPIQYVAIRADITERKKAEEQQSLLASIINSSDEAIFSIDLHGKVTSWNRGANALFGYSLPEMLGKEVTVLIEPGRRHEEDLLIEKIIRKENVEHYETERIRKDGAVIQVSLNVAPITNAEGKVIGASKIARNITELKKAQQHIIELNINLEQKVIERTEQLGIINRELEAFTYSVSHDLRAPLRIIDGFADMLVTDHSDRLDGEGRRLLGIIMANASRMGRLIDDLLNLSHLGRKEIATTAVDMDRLVRSAIDEQLAVYAGTAAKITTDPLLPGYCDQNLILQVWGNFISNSLKYSAKEKEPAIHIWSYRSGSSIVYAVRDNGVGFDMKYADKLFGVFQRLHKATDYEGTGVGLALVQRIVVKHGGKVWAESRPGEGATFCFSLPAKN
jgi:PAS domain S-box-containing protein